MRLHDVDGIEREEIKYHNWIDKQFHSEFSKQDYKCGCGHNFYNASNYTTQTQPLPALFDEKGRVIQFLRNCKCNSTKGVIIFGEGENRGIFSSFHNYLINLSARKSTTVDKELEEFRERHNNLYLPELERTLEVLSWTDSLPSRLEGHQKQKD